MKKCTVDYDLVVKMIANYACAVADKNISGCLDGVVSHEYKQYQEEEYKLHTELITYLASNITDWGDE